MVISTNKNFDFEEFTQGEIVDVATWTVILDSVFRNLPLRAQSMPTNTNWNRAAADTVARQVADRIENQLLEGVPNAARENVVENITSDLRSTLIDRLNSKIDGSVKLIDILETESKGALEQFTRNNGIYRYISLYYDSEALETQPDFAEMASAFEVFCYMKTGATDISFTRARNNGTHMEVQVSAEFPKVMGLDTKNDFIYNQKNGHHRGRTQKRKGAERHQSAGDCGCHQDQYPVFEGFGRGPPRQSSRQIFHQRHHPDLRQIHRAG